ncbi:hypothetical protein JTB14_007631 [Gonioctena quinquepunctata]|nr:hypothetical protein JTB14_007631 [Gonioctena quinquepunctata]
MANNGFILLINVASDDEERLQNRVLRRRLRDQSDPLNVTEKQCKSVYRLSRDMVRQLVETLEPHLPQGVKEELFILNKLKVDILD